MKYADNRWKCWDGTECPKIHALNPHISQVLQVVCGKKDCDPYKCGRPHPANSEWMLNPSIRDGAAHYEKQLEREEKKAEKQKATLEEFAKLRETLKQTEENEKKAANQAKETKEQLKQLERLHPDMQEQFDDLHRKQPRWYNTSRVLTGGATAKPVPIPKPYPKPCPKPIPKAGTHAPQWNNEGDYDQPQWGYEPHPEAGQWNSAWGQGNLPPSEKANRSAKKGTQHGGNYEDPSSKKAKKAKHGEHYEERSDQEQKGKSGYKEQKGKSSDAHEEEQPEMGYPKGKAFGKWHSEGW